MDTATIRTVLSTNPVVWLKMLDVPAYTYKRRPYSATLYPTSFTLDSLLALRICAQRKTHVWCSTSGPSVCRDFPFDCMFWDESRYSNHYWNSIEHKSRRLGKFYLTVLCVPAHTHEYIPYSATLFSTSFTVDSLLALTIRAQRTTYGWWYTLCPTACGGFFV